VNVKRLLALMLIATPAFAGEITRQSVIDGMNAARAEQHLQPLRENARLDSAADDRMHDMEDLGYWAHQSPDGRSPFTWLRVRNYEFELAGENLATGFETEELLMSGWLESKGHRENILSSEYQECGVSIIDGGTTRRAAGKSIVVLFAKPRGATAIASTPDSRP
jgi:uncharacterized protein YkwD